MSQADELEKMLSKFEHLITAEEIEVESRRPKKEVTGSTTWKCMMCGRCCRERWGIFVTENDVKRWIEEERYDIITNIVPVIRTGVKRFGLMSTPEGCIYLTASNECQIHDIKPETCRAYPFYLSNDGRKLLCDSSCSGIGSGEKIEAPHLKTVIRNHCLAIERSGHEGFVRLLSKAQRKAFKKMSSPKKEKIMRFFQNGEYDEYFTLNVEGVNYSVVSINLKTKTPSRELLSKWITNTAKKMQARLITGILRVINGPEKDIIAVYCLVPVPIQDPKKMPLILQLIMSDARAKAAMENEGNKFVMWDEFCS